MDVVGCDARQQCLNTRFHTLLLKLSLLPYCLTALLPYCLTTVLPYCLTTVLPYCLTTLLPYHRTALLPYCLTTVLPYCLTALLPYCLTTVLPYCLIGAACASTGQAPALSPYPISPGYHPLAGMTCSSTGRRHRPLSVRRTRVGAGAVCKAPTLRIAILTKGVLTSYSPHTNLILT